MPVFIDAPTATVTSPHVTVFGWIATDDKGTAVELTVNGRTVPHVLFDRPDVRAVFAHLAYSSGVAASFDLRRLPVEAALRIELRCGPDKERRNVEVDSNVAALCSENAALSEANRAFCLAHLRCPHCGVHGEMLRCTTHLITCLQCKSEFSQTLSAINMISEHLRIQANLADTDNVSANPYVPAVLDLIARVTAGGGWVLDCGAGSRPYRLPNVVNVEIVDYMSTDALAVGEGLPFQDNTFDAAISLAVLEHVRDPFKCANELLRVVKPGAEIIVDVPFLQPLHGYPHHYYNMTQHGLRNLFDHSAEILSCYVPPHGHPIFGVQWLLQQYAAGLSEPARTRFEAMTVSDLCAIDAIKFLSDPAALLSIDARNITACLNTVHVKKPARSSTGTDE
jgi:SAM-dependent methyltransferase